MKLRILTRTRLIAGFLGVACIGAGVGGMGIWSMRSISSQATNILQETTAPLKKVFGLYAGLLEVQVQVRDLLLTDGAQLEATIKTLGDKGVFIESETAALLAIANDKATKSALGAFVAVWGDFKSNLGVLYDEARKGKGKAAAQFMFMMMSGPGQATRDAMNMVVDSYMIRATRMEATSSDLTKSATYVLLAAMILGLLVSIGLGLVVATSISRPVLLAANAASSIARGNLVVNLSDRFKSRSDELGDLTRALEAMSGDLNAGMRTLGAAVASLQTMGDELAGSLSRVHGSVSEIGQGVDKVRSETDEQSAGVEETAATVREMARTIEGLDAEIESQANDVTESSASVELLVGNIGE
ncbi:MAG: methyl-accepting chemotaxis protein, partial [Spirochaetota bacterium]